VISAPNFQFARPERLRERLGDVSQFFQLSKSIDKPAVPLDRMDASKDSIDQAASDSGGGGKKNPPRAT